jgi:hypothetical protein
VLVMSWPGLLAGVVEPCFSLWLRRLPAFGLCYVCDVFLKHSNNIDIYICMRTYLYKYIYIYVYFIFRSTFEKLSRSDLETNKVNYQEHLIIDGNITSH